MRGCLRKTRWLAALGLVCASLSSPVFAQVGGNTEQALAESQAHLDAREFGAAMASAKGISPDPLRARHEALILYGARSYDVALERALQAIDGGQADELLLLNAVRAAIWVQDTTAAQYCQDLFELRLDVMTGEGAANLQWWTDQVVSLSDWVDGMAEQDAATEAVIRRSRITTYTAFGTALAMLFLASKRANRS